MFAVSWEEKKSTCYFKQINKANAIAASDNTNDKNGHDKVRMLFYAEVF